MKQLGAWAGSGHMNVLVPNYEFNEELKFYVEKDGPPESMYKTVGFNDLKQVRIMMEGNDEEKRKSDVKLLRGMTKVEKNNRMMEQSNKHYRKYYEDELENNKALFPEMPFLKVEIKRGQSRGLQKSSWFSWGSTQVEDESGQVSNEKVVGFFKGRIKITNPEEERKYTKEKEYKMKQIMDLINTIH